jgi:hypothetical protein
MKAGRIKKYLILLAEPWLATQWTSRRSPAEFPANREFNRENHDFRPQGGDLKARNPCAAGTF